MVSGCTLGHNLRRRVPLSIKFMTDDPKVDRLSALLQRFPMKVRPLFQGAFDPAGTSFLTPPTGGVLHLVGGAGVLMQGADMLAEINGPCVLFLPRTVPHRLCAHGARSAALLSASVDMGAPENNPLVRALPPLVLVALCNSPELETSCRLLWDEADASRCAHALLLERACEVLMIQLLRYAIAHRLMDTGLLCGLADARLMRVLAAVHADPAAPWTLPRMAGVAYMSRARFAAHFSQVLGEAPGEYLGRWRMGVARSLLVRGMPVKQVAQEAGYASASALTRAFSRRMGQPPSRWLAEQRAATEGQRPAAGISKL